MSNEMMALTDFIFKPRNGCLEVFDLAFKSFFEDVSEEDFGLNDMQEKLGDFVYHSMYPSFIEFFASNEYVLHTPLGTDPNWNVIDCFLRNQQSKGLRRAEEQFLRGIRKSYMSVYEVLEVNVGESILVHDLIQSGEPILVKEKSGTQQIVKWDKLGARLVDCGENIRFAGGFVILPAEVAKEAIKTITTIQSTIDRLMPGTLAGKELQRKLWAKEITSAWMKYHLNSNNEKQNLINIDGDKLQFHRVEFPIVGSINKIIDIVDALPETVQEEPPKTAEYLWLWVKPYKQPFSTKKHTAGDSGNTLIVQCQVTFPDDPNIYSNYADITIEQDLFIVRVNSLERAEKVKKYFNKHLRNQVGEPSIELEDMNIDQPNPPKKTKGKKDNQIPSDEAIKALKSFKDGHYRAWLDTKLPFLDNKTPRQVAQSNNPDKVIDLVKRFENNEIRQAREKNHEVYDINWVKDELGILSLV